MIRLSDKFTYKKLLRYSFPTIIMMVFSSVYGVVDGFFVSNFAGKTPFAAVNFIMPVLMILGCFGFMFGTGASALIGKTMGEGDEKKANEIFTETVVVSLILSAVLTALGIALMPAIATLLGASGQLHSDCVLYGRIFVAGLSFFILQYEFQCLFPTANKPNMGLWVTVAAGVTNVVLDALFVAVFKWGIAGAAIASAIGQAVGGGIPLAYFLCRNGSCLRFCRFRFDFKALIKTCGNGSSEFMSNVAFSIVGIIYNAQLMKYAGENGVAAYGVLMYVSMIFSAIFIGYSVGTAPIVSYHYGAGNRDELKGLIGKSLVITSAVSVLMLASGELLSYPLSRVFVGYDAQLLEMTAHAFKIYSIAFLFCGFSIYGSSFFTALGNGLISALIAFLRTLVFQAAAVIILPALFALNGIWWSIAVAEIMSATVTAFFLLIKRKKYGY
ncbi:MAG: MATE family efflux transporter [Candidatus Neoclostridium sp.]